MLSPDATRRNWCRRYTERLRSLGPELLAECVHHIGSLTPCVNRTQLVALPFGAIAVTLVVAIFSSSTRAHTIETSPAESAGGALVLLDVVVPLLLAAVWYACGVARLWHRSGAGRGLRPLQVSFFVLGWLSLIAALLSPVDELGAELFSAHMVQHEILMLIAAPLLVLARPMQAFLWAFPAHMRSGLSHASRLAWLATTYRALTRPLVAWILHAITLWAWHAPAFFQATLVDRTVHNLQHISFLLTALLFWASLFGARSREAHGAAVLYLFTTMVHSSILGALLTFAARPWYPAYLHTTQHWGLTPLEDQQLGGLIMWVPASLVYVVLGLSFVARWISTSDRGLKTRTG
jgi:putative membrane protein